MTKESLDQCSMVKREVAHELNDFYFSLFNKLRMFDDLKIK